MPKVQKQVSRKKGKKTYYKYVITLSPELVKEKGLNAGDEVTIDVKNVIKDPNGNISETKNTRRVKKSKSDELSN